jgi:hypothetical protein
MPKTTAALPVQVVRLLVFVQRNNTRRLESAPIWHWEDQTAGFYYVIVDAMLKIGFTPEEIRKIGGENYLRIFAAAVNK